MAQSVLRLEAEAGVKFEPAKVDLDQASNVLDRWIAAASRNLVAYVRQVRACLWGWAGLGEWRGCFAQRGGRKGRQVRPGWRARRPLLAAVRPNELRRERLTAPLPVRSLTRSLGPCPSSRPLQEMDAYRLYTVVPFLVKFIDNLTNIYVRYNRKRLKGGKGTEDCLFAIASLFNVLLSVSKVSEPPASSPPCLVLRAGLVRRPACAACARPRPRA